MIYQRRLDDLNDLEKAVELIDQLQSYVEEQDKEITILQEQLKKRPEDILKMIREGKIQEIENTALKEALVGSAKNCERLMKQLVSWQGTIEKEIQDELKNLEENQENSLENLKSKNERMIEENKRHIELLKSSIESQKKANEKLNETISQELEDMTLSFREKAVNEFEEMLEKNKKSLKIATQQYSSQIENHSKIIGDNLENLKEVLNKKLEELEYKQKQFFKFNNFKQVIFWIGTVTNILTLGLLIYIIFVKKAL